MTYFPRKKKTRILIINCEVEFRAAFLARAIIGTIMALVGVNDRYFQLRRLIE